MEIVQKYNPTFAIMKGFAIVGVVVGHCTMYKELEAYVNQYHLAVFFFVAGYFLTDKYVEHPNLLVRKRIKSLYLPFVFSGIVCIIFHNLLVKIHVYDTTLSCREMLLGGEIWRLSCFRQNH